MPKPLLISCDEQNTFIYNAKLDMSTWTFAKTLARKKNTFAISEKTLAETVHYIPKGLRKWNPFQGPFAQLSYIYIYTHTHSHLWLRNIDTKIDVWKFGIWNVTNTVVPLYIYSKNLEPCPYETSSSHYNRHPPAITSRDLIVARGLP